MSEGDKTMETKEAGLGQVGIKLYYVRAIGK